MPRSKKCVLDLTTKKCRKSRRPGRPKCSKSKRKYRKRRSDCGKPRRKRRSDCGKPRRKRRSDCGKPRRKRRSDCGKLRERRSVCKIDPRIASVLQEQHQQERNTLSRRDMFPDTEYWPPRVPDFVPTVTTLTPPSAPGVVDVDVDVEYWPTRPGSDATVVGASMPHSAPGVTKVDIEMSGDAVPDLDAILAEMAASGAAAYATPDDILIPGKLESDIDEAVRDAEKALASSI